MKLKRADNKTHKQVLTQTFDFTTDTDSVLQRIHFLILIHFILGRAVFHRKVNDSSAFYWQIAMLLLLSLQLFKKSKNSQEVWRF